MPRSAVQGREGKEGVIVGCCSCYYSCYGEWLKYWRCGEVVVVREIGGGCVKENKRRKGRGRKEGWRRVKEERGGKVSA